MYLHIIAYSCNTYIIDTRHASYQRDKACKSSEKVVGSRAEPGGLRPELLRFGENNEHSLSAYSLTWPTKGRSGSARRQKPRACNIHKGRAQPWRQVALPHIIHHRLIHRVLSPSAMHERQYVTTAHMHRNPTRNTQCTKSGTLHMEYISRCIYAWP